YLDNLDPEYLRYYYAAKLNNGITDLDLNLEDFALRVNSDLVGKVVNIASRCASFITKKFDGKLSDTVMDEALLGEFQAASASIANHYENRDYSRAIREIMALADKANQFIDAKAPWVLIKDETKQQEAHDVCSLGLNMFRVLITYLKPVLPGMAANVEAFLNDGLTWQGAQTALVGHAINKFKPLMQRVEMDKVNKMIEESKESLVAEKDKIDPNSPLAKEPISPEIEFDDFAKVDLRVAKIAKAEHVEGADKLLKLTLDLGGETRQVFAGIKSAYAPEDIEGKLTVMVANLKPLKMRFGMSEGMVLAAGPGGKEIYILNPDEGSEPGMRVM
ncbi:MAG TPA: methionine--tRNA ligase subunit beta, partial [Pseudoalteromonas sp.]|nr:methionine--tRNA ligase subunit beta [Pseudoalteromonas sp.]